MRPLPAICDAVGESSEPNPDAEPPQRLQIDVVRDGGDWVAFGDIECALMRAANALSRHSALRLGKSSACIALTSAAAVHRLNRDFRGMNKPTNVLSFPARRGATAVTDELEHLGDVVLAAEVIAAEAAQAGIAPIHHLQHLAVHGLLHLLGLEHNCDQDAEEMERLEAEILHQVGIIDPYRSA